MIQTEPVHLVAHALLYGTLAALLAWRWFPADTLDAPRDRMRRRALAAGAIFLLAAVALSWARVREGRHTPPEVIGAWGIAGASGVLTRWVG